MIKREKILITVKTYPTLSKKYGETVCTAGIRPDGSWIRLYPVPFRRLRDEEQYKKYDWVECDVMPSRHDRRPESFNPVDTAQLVPVGHVGTEHGWAERRRLLIQPGQVYTNLRVLLDAAKTNEKSLATFKPTKILKFSIEEEEEPNWNPNKLKAMREANQQLGLFEDEAWRKTFAVIPKLPYSFSYRFEDDTGRQSELQILDWEIGALYDHCLQLCNGDKQCALEKVRQKYWDNFLQTDLHFFLGTTYEYHQRAPNPWVIIGVMPIPHERQMGLGFD